jgi:hypothetical protein
MQLNAAYRLLSSDWFHSLTPEQQAGYLEEHPNSKYADQAKKANETSKESLTPKEAVSKLHPKVAAAAHFAISHAKDEIAGKLNSKISLVKNAGQAFKNLATRKPLTEDHKEALTTVANSVVDHAIELMPGGGIAKTFAKVGFALVMGAILGMRGNKVQAKDYGKTVIGTILGTLEGQAKSKILGRHAGSILTPKPVDAECEDPDTTDNERKPTVRLNAKQRLLATTHLEAAKINPFLASLQQELNQHYKDQMADIDDDRLEVVEGFASVSKALKALGFVMQGTPKTKPAATGSSTRYTMKRKNKSIECISTNSATYINVTKP